MFKIVPVNVLMMMMMIIIIIIIIMCSDMYFSVVATGGCEPTDATNL